MLMRPGGEGGHTRGPCRSTERGGECPAAGRALRLAGESKRARSAPSAIHRSSVLHADGPSPSRASTERLTFA